MHVEDNNKDRPGDPCGGLALKTASAGIQSRAFQANLCVPSGNLRITALHLLTGLGPTLSRQWECCQPLSVLYSVWALSPVVQHLLTDSLTHRLDGFS